MLHTVDFSEIALLSPRWPVEVGSPTLKQSAAGQFPDAIHLGNVRES